MHDYFKEIYSDLSRGMEYQHPPGMIRPENPKFPFKVDPPTEEEIRLSLRKKRNGAAPGPNGIPYVVYKKVPVLLQHLIMILQEMWPNFKLPQSKYGITGLIYKSGATDSVCNYRPITMTNTDGKILLSVIASRSLTFMKYNRYYDLSVQKGFISDMAGCAEHTTMLAELLRNAKQHTRQITICWTDLENAFGSLRHDLIQFALSWYHFPEAIRLFVQDYYEGLSIKIRTNTWTTEPVALLMGIFQGCPLSVQLFNIVWNIALDMVKFSSSTGYDMKEAGIEKHQLSYVDDHTVVSDSPGNAQSMLNTVDVFITWSACIRAKPSKCKSLAFKVFRPGEFSKYKQTMETGYSAYDPKLTISGANIPFLGEEPFKFLGRKISSKRDNHTRAEIKETLIINLKKTDSINITGPMKMWLYNHFVVAFVTWSFTIYDLPISYGEELRAVATKYLKKWIGITKSITNSVLYRSKDHFGLGLTDLVTHLKKMQVCRMHINKYSQDESSKKLYEYMKERDKPPVNKLGLPMKQKIWKPTNALEKAERDTYLDNFTFGNQNSGIEKTTVREDRHNTLRRIERDDEEVRLAKCYSYVIQGDWLNFDAVIRADLRWNSLIYAVPQELFKFLLNSTHNVLPTPDNLKRWGKTVVDIKCSLCGNLNPTLKHILNGCIVALKQGRYTWRHDDILQRMAEQLKSLLEKVNSTKVVSPSIKDRFVVFVKPGEKVKKGKGTYKSGMLFTANDWILDFDNSYDPLIFPHHITQTSLRPDLIIFSNSTRQVILIELTVPAEDNITQRHSDKEDKYAKLVDDIGMNHWKGHIFAVEVGSRGYVAKSFSYALRKLGMAQEAIKKVTRSVGLICLRDSYSIYLSRKNEIWRPWETKHPVSKGKCSPEKEENNIEKNNFCGFEEVETLAVHEKNKRKLCILRKEDISIPQGNKEVEIVATRKSTTKRCAYLKAPPNVRQNSRPPNLPCNKGLHCKSGLKNLGNTCYMNSIIQCLYYTTPLVKYFEDGEHCKDINPKSVYHGRVAREISEVFAALGSGSYNCVSVQEFKTAMGTLHQPFQGYNQHDSHEFLMLFLNWLHEDLRREVPPKNYDNTPDHTVAEISQKNANGDGQSIVTSLFQGEHRCRVICDACFHESLIFEPFTIITLSLPPKGGCTLEDLLQHYYEDSKVEYICPECRKTGTGTRKIDIWRVPPVIILHFNRFEYEVSARKKQNMISFPLEKLSFINHTAEEHKEIAVYNLIGVSNHFGTMNGGHYTSFCKSYAEKVWYNFNDQNVTKLTTSKVNTSAAYLLFYESAN